MNYEQAEEILSIAHSKGLLSPAYSHEPVYSDYVNSANCLLAILEKAGSDGLDTEQATQRFKMSTNSTKIYLRILRNLGYLEMEYRPQQPAVWRLKGF